MSGWEKIVRRDIAWRDLCALEDELVHRVQQNPSERFLLVSEPRPVYTAGRNADHRGLLVTEAQLEAEGAEAVDAPRGGQWTYHGPGQVVVYPIAALENLGLGNRAVRAYSDRLRDAVMRVFLDFELSPVAQDCPYGLFCDDAKLTSFGLSFRRGVTAHGVAVYQRSQQLPFRRIDPCGVVGGRVTSLEELAVPIDWDSLADALAQAITRRFP